MNSAISGYKLDETIQWFCSRTTSTHSGESPYELTISALEELKCRRRGGKPPFDPTLGDIVAAVEELPTLNERQMLMLYVASDNRSDLIDMGKAANAKTADQLVELGVMDSWLRVTDLGRKVLKS